MKKDCGALELAPWFGRRLFCTSEFNEFAAHVQAVFACFGRGQNLEWSWALDIGVTGCGDLEEFVGSQVEKNEFVAFKKTETIGAGPDSLAADLKSNFGQKICLIFLTEAGGVAGIVHEPSEHVEVI